MALVGIDLGTTNSVVATMADERVYVIENAEGKQTTPSMVFFQSGKLDDALVGDSAVFSVFTDPDRSVRFIRREMGRHDFLFRVEDEEYTAEEISAVILKKLVKDAAAFLAEPVTDAIITVPAWFSDRERAAMARAGELAGLNVRALLPEPIAAAISYAEGQRDSLVGKTILVYHLGGSTFNVCIISVNRESGDGSPMAFQILSHNGSHDLGGCDWDTRLAEHVCHRFAEKNGGKDPADDPVSFNRLLFECQRARVRLSFTKPGESADVPCTHEGIDCRISVTRHELEQLTESLLNETIVKTEQLVRDEMGVGGSWDRIDVILLDGGSAKMPAVAQRLEEASGMKPVTHRGVDLNAARGAAVFGFAPDAWTIVSELHEPASRTQTISTLQGRTTNQGQTTSRGQFKPNDEVVRDIVDCTVYSPGEVLRGESITVQVFVHIPEDANRAAQQAKRFDPNAEQQGATSLGTEIARGSKLTFELHMNQGNVNPASQTLVWTGCPDSARFTVSIPKDTRSEKSMGTVIVSQDSIPIGTITFDLTLVEAHSEETHDTRLTGHARRYKKAFISYASKDRNEVLRRIQMLSHVGIESFFDLFSLKSGDVYAEKLFEYISQSDVMYLFWSAAARKSAWVEKEWRYGLTQKGDRYIHPVIIEGPPVPLPPPELEHLHFNDTVIYFVSNEVVYGTSRTPSVESTTNGSTAVVEIYLPNGVRICVPANDVSAVSSAIAAAGQLSGSYKECQQDAGS